MKPKPRPPADLWEQLEAAIAPTHCKAIDRNANCFTTREFAGHIRRPRPTAHRMLQDMVRRKLIRAVWFQQPNDAGIMVVRQGYEWIGQCPKP
jgi:hypothetical protein